MKTSNSKTKAFAFLGTAFVLFIALLFTGCSNAASGNTSTGIIEGVWETVSIKEDNDTSQFPQKQGDGSIMHLYSCFSEGKLYEVRAIEGSSKPTQNGIFKLASWELNYTYANGILRLPMGQAPFTITGNTATLTGPAFTIKYKRVSSPTVEQIKAAK